VAPAPSTPTFEIRHFHFSAAGITAQLQDDTRFGNWPAVYVLADAKRIYVGESLNVAIRLRQHKDSPEKRDLSDARVVLDQRFNKSAALDLESFLIRLLAGDGRFEVLNRNDGITNSDYFERDRYRAAFQAIFDHLRSRDLFAQSRTAIENSDLFKLSPFKALTADQEDAVANIVEALLKDLSGGTKTTSVVSGGPGTGKTVVGIYLMKLLSDLATDRADDTADAEAALSEFFTDDRRLRLKDLRLGLVVPQQSLRASVKKVFAKTPGLRKDMVLSPFDVGKASVPFDVLIVDETHRLAQRANMPSAAQNKQFTDINMRLFGNDDVAHTQLDWIQHQSRHRVLLLDTAQAVRPADLPTALLDELTATAERSQRRFALSSQMRVSAGGDYIKYARQVLSNSPPAARATFEAYDLRLFESLSELRAALKACESHSGLARLVAGYAWPWNSKRDPERYDIQLDGESLRWNKTAVDWVNSPTSTDEVGSIHTIQGYDLNYAGVIIGDDLRYDPVAQRLSFNRGSYYDTKGKENNPRIGRTYNDDDLFRFVTNIYGVLMTRGIRGTYVYATDPALRAYLRRYL
jgi:DUF2075 family protein